MEGTSTRRSKVTLLFSQTCSVDFFMLSPHDKPAFLALIPPSFTSLNTSNYIVIMGETSYIITSWIVNKATLCYSTWARAPGTAFWLVHNWPLGLRGIYITLGYTFFSSIENFSAYCPVLRGSILLLPRHPSVFARMARRQLLSHSMF